MIDVPTYTGAMKPIDDGSYRPTVYGFLVAAAGEAHAGHTVVARNRRAAVEADGVIPMRFRCSCGITFSMAPTFRRLAALEGVPETLAAHQGVEK